jgi:glutamate carboxypeptidase
MPELEAALAAARQRRESAIRLLRGWVEQGSYTADTAGVNAMGQMLQDAFGDLADLEAHVRAGRDGIGDHLLWTTAAWDDARGDRVLLVGHHDTVFPPGTFEGWKVDGDVARGPGCLDMKGGLVVVHTALAALSDAAALAELPVAVLCVADEEVGSPDSRELTEEVARGAACALVFEGGRAGDAIITRRRGTGAVAAHVTGKAAHAGNHHADGVNAIWALARFVDAAQALTDYGKGVTVNVGTMRGGTSRNTVPAEAECGIDLRFERAADGERAVTELDRIARRIAGETGAAFRLEGGVRRPPLERTAASAALCERYARAARAAGLGGGEAGLIGGGSDGNNVAALGVPVIDGLGPRGAGFHTPDEHIELSSLPLRTEALIRFLLG